MSPLNHLSPMGPINELERCPSRVWSQRTRFIPMSFYRDAGSTLLNLVNQWLNFWCSRPHPFRYGNQNKVTPLRRLEVTNSTLVSLCRDTTRPGGAARALACPLNRRPLKAFSEIERVREPWRSNIPVLFFL